MSFFPIGTQLGSIHPELNKSADNTDTQTSEKLKPSADISDLAHQYFTDIKNFRDERRQLDSINFAHQEITLREIYEVILTDISQDGVLNQMYEGYRKGEIKNPEDLKHTLEKGNSEADPIFRDSLFNYSYDVDRQALVIQNKRRPQEVIQLGQTNPSTEIPQQPGQALGIFFWRNYKPGYRADVALTIDAPDKDNKHTKYNFKNKIHGMNSNKVIKPVTVITSGFSQVPVSA
ncbi:MAG TPA: hypothetical protein VHA74_01860 [Candidatus Dojkabacteria bacterium]|nr:hypothetical protein [Candidatus Dojkabacteria bacterium]